jgi:exopolysaccharide biosynthesis polyprenyl glycosylphosphotransferase
MAEVISTRQDSLAPPTGVIPAQRGAPGRPAHVVPWRRRRAAALLTIDSVAVIAAVTCGYAIRFGPSMTTHGVSYLAVGAGIFCGWIGMLAVADTYESRHLGVGTDEYRRVAVATFRVWGATAIGCYVLHAQVARGFCIVAMPLGLGLLLTGRAAARNHLIGLRKRGESLHRVVMVGDRQAVAELTAQFRRQPAAGFHVVGACLPAEQDQLRAGDAIPVLGSVESIPSVVTRYEADTVVVASSAGIDANLARRIAWGLEGTGTDLVVAPAVAEIAGGRVSLRPVAGLPLLHLSEPVFTGWRKVTKACLDRALAGLALLVLAPMLVLVAVAIRLDSAGPALYAQKRIGKDGRAFVVWKFRTMHTDAARRLTEIAALNESDGLLFKVRDDPRVTRLGRPLRRLSIDEIPQLINVVLGEMSLVGPRPLPVSESDFAGDTRRRLLVMPGLTGLWQVSGRSALSWDDAVRLDLYYVENWSILLDLTIMLRTVRAVLTGSGAY